MKYYCEQCDKEVDDNGPYENSKGDYACQECMEKSIAMTEARWDD